MPTPKKNESKQGFLNRCTNELIEKEGKDSDQAYAICNSYWDESSNARASMSLTLDMELARGDNKKRTFKITAYTGQRVSRFWGDVIIDVAGMKAKNSIPVLREHERDRIVGHSRKAWKENNQFYLSGDVSEATPDGREVAALADEGFPWQASVGIFGRKIEVIESKSTAKVNGQTVEGPIDIWRESLVGEVSFVALGADDNTAAIVLSEDGPEAGEVTWTSQTIQLDKEERKMDLKEFQEKHPDLYASIVKGATETGVAQGREEGMKSGAEKERERIKAVQAQLIPGHEKLINELMWDGETTGEQAAVQVLQAEKQIRAKVKNDITDDSPEVVEQPAVEEELTETEDETLPIEERAKAKWDKDRELRAEFGGDFAVYLAYEKASEIGRIKVLKSK